MANELIKVYAKERGIYLWQIADKLGVSEGTFCRKLRKELPDTESSRIFTVIEEIAQGKEAPL